MNSTRNGLRLNNFLRFFLKKKTEAIVKQLNLPIQVFVATGKSVYRKPRVGMWTYLCQQARDAVSELKKHLKFLANRKISPSKSTKTEAFLLGTLPVDPRINC